jgi:hypothetical protein
VINTVVKRKLALIYNGHVAYMVDSTHMHEFANMILIY